MNRKHYILFFLFGLLLAGTGCKKYLQIQPEGAYTENQVFANEKAAQEMLNGLYISMADNSLYGQALSQTTIELMAQRYYVTASGTNGQYVPFQLYQYTSTTAQPTFDAIWQKAYNTILTANLFLKRIQGSVENHVLSQEHCDQMKGEALAVRAMLHFDMLRLFGPVYSLGANQAAIPYYTLADGKAQPIISSTAIVDSVLLDLNTAEGLLTNDAVIQGGVTTSADFYIGSRSQRLNYYAIQALKARIYLWAGKAQEAHDTALAVLTASEQWFPWTPYTSIVGTTYPNRIFSPEVMFAVYNANLYTNYMATFSSGNLDDGILAPTTNGLNAAFENNLNDYRYGSTWTVTAAKTYRTFDKYADQGGGRPGRFWQPLIRKSELYYILAETDADPDQALGYLNAVRSNRGLGVLAGDVNLPAEIQKEYIKEFWGEGQLFFYYKRNNTATIPSGVTNLPVAPVYVVPLPSSETTPR